MDCDSLSLNPWPKRAPGPRQCRGFIQSEVQEVLRGKSIKYRASPASLALEVKKGKTKKGDEFGNAETPNRRRNLGKHSHHIAIMPGEAQLILAKREKM